MNEQNLDGALMMPTLVSLIEERMRDDPDLCADVIHAFNEWMVEEFPFFYEGRIVATPYITPGLVDRAVAELEWVIERGAKAVLMRPGPAWGYRGPRSFGLKEFDPFWRLIEESGVVPILHVSDSGYDRYYNEWQGVEAEMSHFGEPEPFLMSMLFHPPTDRGHGDVADLPWHLLALPRGRASPASKPAAAGFPGCSPISTSCRRGSRRSTRTCRPTRSSATSTCS